MLTIVLSATSCATQRKTAEASHSQEQSSVSAATEQTLRLEEQTAALVSRLFEERMNALRETTATTDEATERVTEIFDTTQPTDSVTGTPPLLSRTTERRNATSSEQTREQTEATAKEATEADIGQASTLAAGRRPPQTRRAAPRARERSGRRKAAQTRSCGCR